MAVNSVIAEARKKLSALKNAVPCGTTPEEWSRVHWPERIRTLCTRINDQIPSNPGDSARVGKNAEQKERLWKVSKLRQYLEEVEDIGKVIQLVQCSNLFIDCEERHLNSCVFTPVLTFLETADGVLERIRDCNKRARIALHHARLVISVEDQHVGSEETSLTNSSITLPQKMRFADFTQHLKKLETVPELKAFLQVCEDQASLSFDNFFIMKYPNGRTTTFRNRAIVHRHVLVAHAKIVHCTKSTREKALSACWEYLAGCFGDEGRGLPDKSLEITNVEELRSEMKKLEALTRSASARFSSHLGTGPDDVQKTAVQLCVNILLASPELHLEAYLATLSRASLPKVLKTEPFRPYRGISRGIGKIHRIISERCFFSKIEAGILRCKVGKNFHHLAPIWQAFEEIDTDHIPRDALFRFFQKSHSPLVKAQCRAFLRFCQRRPLQAIATRKEKLVKNWTRQIVLVDGLKRFFQKFKTSISSTQIFGNTQIFRRSDERVNASVIMSPSGILLGRGSLALNELGGILASSSRASSFFEDQTQSVGAFAHQFPESIYLAHVRANIQESETMDVVLNQSLLSRYGVFQRVDKALASQALNLRSALEKVAQHLGFKENADLKAKFDEVESDCRVSKESARERAETFLTPKNLFNCDGVDKEYSAKGSSFATLRDKLLDEQAYQRLLGKKSQFLDGGNTTEICSICLEKNRLEVCTVMCQKGHLGCMPCVKQLRTSSLESSSPRCPECREPVIKECLPLKLLFENRSEQVTNSTTQTGESTSKRVAGSTEGPEGTRKRARCATSSSA